MPDDNQRSTTLWGVLVSQIGQVSTMSTQCRHNLADLLVARMVELYGGTPEQLREARKPRDCGELKLSTREIAAGIVSEKASLLALGLAAVVEAIDGHDSLARAGLLEALACKRPIGRAFRAELESLGIYPEPEDIAGGDDNAG